jgi:maleate isomerase
MPDALGYRVKFGVLAPAANTVVQPEYDAMRPVGVTNNVVRIPMPGANLTSWSSDSDYASVVKSLDAGIEDAVDAAMLLNPDHLVMGISIESIWGGDAASLPRLVVADQLRRRVEARATNGAGLTQCTDALAAAFQAYDVHGTVGIIDPYFPVTEAHVGQLMHELGYDVARFEHLPTTKPVDIPDIKPKQIFAALRKLDGDDICAIVQFGANLAMMRAAAEAERWLGKPVIAINVATYWHALRKNGITDQKAGCGALLEFH